MDVAALRRETRLDHEAVENIMPVMRKDLDRDMYLSVLRRLFGIVEAWETTSRTGLPPKLIPLAEERSRLGLLTDDLQDFGVVDLNLPKPILPCFTGVAETLGAMYVMEGSRLGGQFIARHVESVLGLTSGRGSRYFRGFGDETGRKWTELLKVLETEVPAHETADSIRGAKKMFSAFGEWMRLATD